MKLLARPIAPIVFGLNSNYENTLGNTGGTILIVLLWRGRKDSCFTKKT